MVQEIILRPWELIHSWAILLRLCATGRKVAICMEAWDMMSEMGCDKEEESGVERNNAGFASITARSSEPIKAFLSQL